MKAGKISLSYVILVFETVRDMYVGLFGDFLHVHFIIRTVFLLLLSWIAIVLFLKIFKYLVGPVFVLFFYHIFFRLHNFFFVETPAEWIYIHYYSKDLPNFEKAYLRLTDKADKNRDLLSKLGFGMAVMKVRSAERRFAYFLLSLSTLWIVAFGLYIEFFTVPPQVFDGGFLFGQRGQGALTSQDNNRQSEDYVNENEINDVNIYIVYPPGTVNPTEWDGVTMLVLNERGQGGAWLRNGPGISGFVVTQVLWGDMVLDYLNYFVPDNYVNGLYWLRVRTPDGNTGYLSSSLVEVYR